MNVEARAVLDAGGNVGQRRVDGVADDQSVVVPPSRRQTPHTRRYVAVHGHLHPNELKKNLEIIRFLQNKIKWFQFAQDGADLNERRKVWQLIVWSGQTFSASLQSRLGFDSEKSIHIFKFQQIGFKFVSRQDSQSERQQQEESSEAAVCYLMISRRSCVPWSRSKTHIHLQHLFFFYFFIYLFSPFDPDRVGSPVLSCHFQKIPTLLFLVEFRFILYESIALENFYISSFDAETAE